MLNRMPVGWTASVSSAIALCLLCGSSVERANAQTGAASQWVTPDARSLGMGRAFTAIAEGPTAVWWNPGALGFTEGIYMSPLSYYQLVPGLADDIWFWPFGATVGRDGIGLGAYVGYLDWGESVITNEAGLELGMSYPYEYTAILGVGADLDRLLDFGSERTRFGVGVSGKLFHVDFDLPPGSPPDWGPGTGSSWDLDVGFLGSYTVPTDSDTLGGANSTSSGRAPDGYVRFRGGMVIHNLLDRRIDYGDPSGSAPLGQSLRLGGAVETGFGQWSELPKLGNLFHGALSFDIERRLTDLDKRTIYHAGIEGSILSILTLRLGRIEDNESHISDFTYGAGLGLGYPEPS